IIAEFGTLSRLTGDDRYYKAAKKAFKAVVDRRSPKELVGTAMNIETGAWLDMTDSIHPPVDSFFEYLFDGWDLFRDEDVRRWYHMLTRAILRFEGDVFNGHLWFKRVNMDTADLVSRRQSELGSFYAGLLGQSGYLREGEAYHDSWTSLLDRYEVLPGSIADYQTGDVGYAGNELGPEYV